jgi:hypothetical protein
LRHFCDTHETPTDADAETGAIDADPDAETGARKRETHRRPPPIPMQILRHCAESADGAKHWIMDHEAPTAQNTGSWITKRDADTGARKK